MVVVDSAQAVRNGSLILVSGPSRGGKSRWAEHLLRNEVRVTYIATSAERPDDDAWQRRIALHRERRPEHWHLLEPGADLIASIASLPPDQAVLIDALGAFVAIHLQQEDIQWADLCSDLMQALSTTRCTVVMVIEETGWGVVPPTRVGGLFRDRLGHLAQQLDRVADAAWLVIQGRAIDLHANSTPVP
mgnify:FL=1